MTQELDSFTKQYVATALWSSADGEGNPLDSNYSASDICARSLSRMVDDCSRFQRDMEEYITDENLLRKPDLDTRGTYGHDYWLTRNRHGAGF